MHHATLPDEADLARLVERFYVRARADEELGTLFNAAIADWPAHLARLEHFWASVMLGTGTYHGSPMAAHQQHRDAITPAMFARWLALWEDTARETLKPEAADAVTAKARRIAESLQLGLWFRMNPRAA